MLFRAVCLDLNFPSLPESLSSGLAFPCGRFSISCSSSPPSEKDQLKQLGFSRILQFRREHSWSWLPQIYIYISFAALFVSSMHYTGACWTALTFLKTVIYYVLGKRKSLYSVRTPGFLLVSSKFRTRVH